MSTVRARRRRARARRPRERQGQQGSSRCRLPAMTRGFPPRRGRQEPRSGPEASLLTAGGAGDMCAPGRQAHVSVLPQVGAATEGIITTGDSIAGNGGCPARTVPPDRNPLGRKRKVGEKGSHLLPLGVHATKGVCGTRPRSPLPRARDWNLGRADGRIIDKALAGCVPRA
jgi:hypothetical protein